MKNSDRAVMAFAVGLLLLVLAYLGLPWQSISAWMDKPESPAWVQAVGSVVALLLALGIATWQHLAQLQRDKERSKREDDRVLALLRRLATASGQLVESLRVGEIERLKTEEGRKLYRRSLRPLLIELNAQVQTIPLQMLPNAALLDAVVALRSGLAMLIAITGGEHFQAAPSDDENLIERIGKRLGGTAAKLATLATRN